MCLAIPAKVTQLLSDNLATVDLSGIEQKISLDLVQDVKIGDYVIIHVGYALKKLDEHEALETLKLFELAFKYLAEGSRP